MSGVSGTMSNYMDLGTPSRDLCHLLNWHIGLKHVDGIQYTGEFNVFDCVVVIIEVDNILRQFGLPVRSEEHLHVWCL